MDESSEELFFKPAILKNVKCVLICLGGIKNNVEHSCILIE